MATAHTSGAVALLLAKTPSLGVADLKDAILGKGHPLPSLAGTALEGGRPTVCKPIRGCVPA